MKEIIKKFNLPKYINGKSFAEASKLIEKKFDGRSDAEAVETKNDLMRRLRDAQEYVKGLQDYNQQPQEDPNQEYQDQYAYGGYKDTNDYPHGGSHDPRPQVQGLDREGLPVYQVPYAMEGNPQFALEDNVTPNLDGSSPVEYQLPEIKSLGADLPVYDINLTNNEIPALTPEMVISMSDNNKKGKGKEKKDINKEKLSKALMAAGNIAPSAMNLAQLATLKKSPEYRSGRMNSTYEKQITDEAAMQRAQATENAGQRNAMRSNSGSQSMLLNNLRGQSLNALKAQGDAYAQSVRSNQEENRRANQFDVTKEQFNINAQKGDDIINQQNQGAYDSTKSSLMAGLANDLGKMSKEALFKKYPELMGMDYDWLGKKTKKKNKTA